MAKICVEIRYNRRDAESVFFIHVCFYMPVCSTYLRIVCVNETNACICVCVCVCVCGLYCK